MNWIKRLVFTLLIGVGCLFNAFCAEVQSATPLFLNEIMASNGSVIIDEDGDHTDWIEIYYDGEEPLSLELFGLTDDPDEPFQWIFPDTTIYPGEYMMIWASGKDRNTPGQPLHTNFSISVDGEVSGHTDSTITLEPTEELRVEAVFSGGTGTDPVTTPDQIYLHQNYPNPFNTSTVITFDLPERSEVILNIYDIIGRKVTQLINDLKNEGTHEVLWDAGAQSSGVYIVQLIVNPGFGVGSGVILTEKITFMK